MSVFEVEAPIVRQVSTYRGDTLWSVASREMGDPERWYELIWLNGLVSPYLTDDPAAAGPGVLLTGSPILIPGTGISAPTALDAAAVFGIDIDLTNGRLSAANGDLVAVAGVPNLVQAIRNAINTPIGDLRFHPDYGCGVHRLLGARGTPDTLQLANALVYRAVSGDARIDRVTTARADLTGDVLRVDLTAVAVSGEAINVST